MSDCVNPVSEFDNVQDSVCVSVKKIMDACRDQDCMENVPVYLTPESQDILENATSVKARSAELLYADVDVEPVPYQDGYFNVDIQFYYRVIADAVMRGVKPVTIYGLATADRQTVLYGGEGESRAFDSAGGAGDRQPVGVVEAVDPVILCARIAGKGDDCRPRSCPGELPETVASAFDDELSFGDRERQLQVTLGQFSLIRLERDTQLLIPSYSFCVPGKACGAGAGSCPENPCEAFARMQFPVSAFFPTEEDVTICGDEGGGCGCGCGNNDQNDSGENRPGQRPEGPGHGSGRPRR